MFSFKADGKPVLMWWNITSEKLKFNLVMVLASKQQTRTLQGFILRTNISLFSIDDMIYNIWRQQQEEDVVKDTTRTCT